MDSERWKRIDDLFQAALERPLADRDAFLKQACGGDSILEQDVRSLLASASGAGSFLESPALEVAARDISQPDLTGQSFSHYKILEVLGAGGMGVVYKAFDSRLDRLVALKFLPSHMRHNPELKQRLKDEARAASALDHSNIVVIYDIDETPGGGLFIAMAYHAGATLQERIKQDNGAGMPVSEALQIARQVASGLSKAHERGIFHRDIKPSNIIVAKDGVARIIDFGLAKTSDGTATMDGTAKGTPLYMSPEQASGKPVDFRTDLWSLGVVLFEMLAGRSPFSGESHLSVMRAIVQDAPAALRELRPGLSAEVECIVTKALEKDPAKRYQSAAQMAADLSAALTAVNAPAVQPGVRRAYAVFGLVIVLIVAGLSAWLYQRSEKRHWAREQAIPQIATLQAENRAVAAYLLLQRAERYLPGDPQLAQITAGLTHRASVSSTPPGATVEIKDYLSPDDPWVSLGTTPLKDVVIPIGYLRWRVSKAGVGEMTVAPETSGLFGPFPEFNFHLDLTTAAPKGMVAVPATKFDGVIWSIGGVGPYEFPLFYMDQYEVSNRAYQEFVDQGGYQKQEYWVEKFVRDGHEVTWDEAMGLMRDSTGRPGPSTWQAGHYPAGQADYPVGGVSWYEAAAFAAFVHKSLPVITQWYLAAPSSIARHILPISNFSGTTTAPPGKYRGVGPYGTYDMAGNVSEWCRNEAGSGTRFSLGGNWNTVPAEYIEPISLPPLNRKPGNGFRCVRNTADLPLETLKEVRPRFRDFSQAKPVSEHVFRTFIQPMYAYDRTPLNAKAERVDPGSTDWTKEKITFDAAYGNERVTAYLFLPAKVKPPYQTVIFFPSARVWASSNSRTLGDMQFIDYVIQGGRAVLYPVYKGTYERPGVVNDDLAVTVAGKELLIQQAKDLRRSIDYLYERRDIDQKRIGYMGVSMGAAAGVVFAGLEDRIKAFIMLDGGFNAEEVLPGTDQADFVPRIKMPVLMICGQFDWIFMGKDALYKMLGTRIEDKHFVTLPTDHDVSEDRPHLVSAVVTFLDRYFGRVE
jgi:formylglycine-generating enzyme required for sulfatase activity/dienelactone hydrolase